MKLRDRATRGPSLRRPLVSCLFGLLLLALSSHASTTPQQMGTVVGVVLEKMSNNSDAPVQGAQVFIETGTDDKGKPIRKLEEEATDEKGRYEFPHAPGYWTVIIHKEPFYGEGPPKHVRVWPRRRTPSVTTYLTPHNERITAAVQLRNLLADQTLEVQKRLEQGLVQVMPLVAFCEPYENKECDLVRSTSDALARRNIEQAAARADSLVSLLRPTAPPPPPLPFALRAGQSVYIVAFRTARPTPSTGGVADYRDSALDAERELRKRIEKRQLFCVVDRPSEADFILLINLDDRAAEGLALPPDAYQNYFKDDFDLDALRDAAYGRVLVGPLKLPTVGRLTDRLVERLREKVTAAK